MLDRLLKGLGIAALAVSSLAILFMAVLGTADVVTYLVIGRPFVGANESTEVALAVAVAMTLAYTQRRGEHVTVDIVVQSLPSWGKRLSRILAIVVACICMALLTWRGWALALDSVRIRETAAALPGFSIYPWKVVFALGITLATLECFRQMIWIVAGRLDFLDEEDNPDE